MILDFAKSHPWGVLNRWLSKESSSIGMESFIKPCVNEKKKVQGAIKQPREQSISRLYTMDTCRVMYDILPTLLP